jgi:arylsulfatase A-like enzyme
VAGTIDILPTAAAVSGAALPAKKIDGCSILPLLEGKPGAKSPHPAYFYQARGVRAGDWKLLAGAKGAKGKQLFNLAKDIGEKNNVAADHPDVVERLTKLLEDFKSELKSDGRPAGKL